MPSTDRTTPSLLLDTHCWIEIACGKPVDRHALRLIEAAASARRLYASVISAWEISMLASKGRIRISSDPTDWCQKSIHRMGLMMLPLSFEAAIASTVLPESFHGDPADRFLVATARELDHLLVTRDREILAYSKRGHVQTLRI